MQELFTATFHTAYGCSGTYTLDTSGDTSKGVVTYTETVRSNQVNVSGGPAPGRCTANGGYRYVEIFATVADHQVTGTYSYDAPHWICQAKMDAVQYALNTMSQPASFLPLHATIR